MLAQGAAAIALKPAPAVFAAANTAGCVRGSEPIRSASACKAAAAAMAMPFEGLLAVRSLPPSGTTPSVAIRQRCRSALPAAT